MLPLPIDERPQRRLHHGIVRVQLLRLAALALPGEPAQLGTRVAAAAIDATACAGLALALGRRRRPGAIAAVAVAYHLVCWTATGRTLGGLVMGERVVSLDGSQPSIVQAGLRPAAPPLAMRRGRPVPDE